MKKFMLMTFLIQLILLTNLLGQENNKMFTQENITLINGTHISSAELKNKIIVVNVWATWCKFCIKEIPDLNKLVMKYQNIENIVFLAIAPHETDHSKKVISFLEKNEFLFQHVASDTNLTFSITNEEVRYPTTINYNGNGQPVEKFEGVLNKKELKKIDWIINKFVADRYP